MGIGGISNFNKYTAIQTQYKQNKVGNQSKDIDNKSVSKQEMTEEAAKVIAETKAAAKRPIDEAEIKRRQAARDAMRDFDPAMVMGQSINPERLAAEKEKSAKFAPIQNKLLSGQPLTADEKSFLRENYPDLYAKAVQIEEEVKSFKDQLKGCKSKEEATRLYMAKKVQCLNAGNKDGSILFMVSAIDEVYRSI